MDVKKIKKYRNIKGYTLADLSSLTGYTSSFLSQLERGIKQPSLEALRTIASYLDVPIFQLLSDEEKEVSDAGETGVQSYVVIHKENRKKAVMPEILTEYEFVTPYLSEGQDNAKVVGMCISLRSGAWACEKQISLDYDISVYIIRGSAEIQIAGEVLTLKEGDSIYLYAHAPHNFLNCGDDELIMIGYTAKEAIKSPG